MNKSDTTAQIFSALAKAQAEFPAIPRSRTVTVQSQKGSYKFAYAPFEDILRAVKPILAAHGLAYSQGSDGDKLITVVTHESGEWFSHGTAIINLGGSAQGYGSALTYARRYGFCGAFGIQADDDDDANAADGNAITAQSDKWGAMGKGVLGKSPTTEMQADALQLLSPGDREGARRTAADIESLVEEGRASEAKEILDAHLAGVRAYDKKHETDKAMTLELAMWGLLGSKARSALKISNKPTARAA